MSNFFLISDDLQHDRCFVKAVQEKIADYFKSIPIDIENMVEFTDGCSCQYKSRNCMGDISTACQHLNYASISRNFYETSHAKGPQDAAGGFLKKQADLAVLRGTTKIQSARDFYDYANKYLVVPKSGIYKRRIFKYIESIDRIGKTTEYKPVSENRKIHNIRSDLNSPNQLSGLSCFECDQCLFGDLSNCQNKEYCGPYREIHMNISNGRHTADSTEDSADENVSELVSVNDVVAVLADDHEYEYFLLKVSALPEKIKSVQRDDWGNSFPAGANIVRGFYYIRNSKNPLKYELVKKRVAIVYSVAIRYICDFTSRNMIAL